MRTTVRFRNDGHERLLPTRSSSVYDCFSSGCKSGIFDTPAEEPVAKTASSPLPSPPPSQRCLRRLSHQPSDKPQIHQQHRCRPSPPTTFSFASGGAISADVAPHSPSRSSPPPSCSRSPATPWALRPPRPRPRPTGIDSRPSSTSPSSTTPPIRAQDLWMDPTTSSSN